MPSSVYRRAIFFIYFSQLNQCHNSITSVGIILTYICESETIRGKLFSYPLDSLKTSSRKLVLKPTGGLKMENALSLSIRKKKRQAQRIHT